MKKFIIYLFLSIGLSINAQYRVVWNGKMVSFSGGLVSIQESDISQSPSQPSAEFIIYKFVDYSEVSSINDTFSLADIRSMWESDEMIIDGYGSRPGPDLDDSAKVVTTAYGQDTVRHVFLWANSGGTNGDKGGQIYGELWLNDIDNTGDTVTVLEKKYKRKLGPNWHKSAGGKMGGFGSYNRISQFGNNPVSGGIYGPICVDSAYYYSKHRGSLFRLSSEVKDGVYCYEHNMWFPSSCATKAYGQHYTATDEAPSGEWHEYNLKIIRNTIASPGVANKDGYIEFSRNDTVKYVNDTIVIGRYSDIYIDYNSCTVITDNNLARTIDTWVEFDDEIIYRRTDWAEAIEHHIVGDVITTPQLGTPNTGSGQGNLLWEQRFDEMALVNPITATHLDTMFGSYRAASNWGDSDNRILDDGGGDHYWASYWDSGVTGGAAGTQIEKNLDSGFGAPDSLSGLKEFWFSWNQRAPSGFAEEASGKLVGGARGGYAPIPYAPGDPLPADYDGFSLRKTYNSSETDRCQLYWFGMQTRYGESSYAWVDPYPDGSVLYVNADTDWHNRAIRFVIGDDGADSIDTFIEYYYDQQLAGRWDTLSLSRADTITGYQLMIGTFPGSSDPANSAWKWDYDDFFFFTFSDGDSTYTGTERMVDSGFVDIPGWPKGEDITGWGDFNSYSPVHPITHDQLYLAHDNVVNGDYIGQVFTLFTDSVFNDRSSGSYSWDIVSGDASSAFVVNSGMLTVNDYTAITGDFNLGIEISHGTDKDTANCEVRYFASNNIFIDVNHGGTNQGTFLNPYQNFNAVDNFGEIAGPVQVWIKRGTSFVPGGISLTNNTGEYIYFAVYGQGNLPVFDYSGQGKHEINMFTIGESGAPETGDDCDSIVLMDLRFLATSTDSIQAIYGNHESQYIEFYRLDFSNINDGNGAIYLRGRNDSEGPFVPSYVTAHDLTFDSISRAVGHRAIKFETQGVDIQNILIEKQPRPGMLFGEWALDFGTAKYLYITGYNTIWDEALQLRSQNTTVEWLYVKDFGNSIDIQNQDYDGTDRPHPYGITVKNAYFETPGNDAINFYNDDGATTDVFDTITFENIFIDSPGGKGIDLDSDGNTMNFNNIVILSCLIRNAGDDGIEVSTYNDKVTANNNIIVGSAVLDLDQNDISTNKTLQNVIYTTKSGTWGTENNLYDTDTANPFVGGGDYRTADGISAVIDAGTDTGREKDMIGNEIGTQDIGAFEKDGTEYNWTDR